MSSLESMDTFFEVFGQEGLLTVTSVRGVERIAEPFHYEVGFQCPWVDPDKARGGTAFFDLNAGEKMVRGVVESLEIDVTAAPEDGVGNVSFVAHVRPPQYLSLAYRRGFRIFQDQTVIDILKAVFKEASVPDEEVDWAGVSGSYPERTYTVQYDESEWDFIHRLMEEEGLYYVFEHEAELCTMVMMDDNAAFEAAEPATLAHLDESAHAGQRPGVWGFAERRTVVESKVTLRDFDFERPSTDLTVEVTADEAFEREHYAYPGFYTDDTEGERLAQVRLDAFRSKRVISTMETNLLGARPGTYFELLEHPVFEGERVITGVEISLQLRQGIAARSEGESGLTVRLTTMPREQTYRAPLCTPKPQVIGPQTGLVAGPTGEEIHVDEFGRVKVQFFWDRQGTGDEKASCWMRLTQAHTTGSVMIPRIGWEVFVEFLDGDPDRPVCLGRVWNPATPAPHALPAGKTMSSHGSVSTPGSGGVNEIVMEDAAGAESLTINAHYNQTTVVANNRTTSIGANLDYSVTATRSVDIGGNETRVILANENDSVTGDHTIDVGGIRAVKASGCASEETTGSMALSVSGMENIIVGSPASALLDVVADAVIDKVSGAAASAAERAQSALLGPIEPALDAAKKAIGSAHEYAGKASELLGPGAPAMKELTDATESLKGVAEAADVGDFAKGMAKSTLEGALDKVKQAVGVDPEAAGGADGAGSGGSGTWGMTVGGNVTESVGGVAVFSTATGISVKIGGSNTELVGAARAEMIRGGKSEDTGGSKLETVGIYQVKAGKSFGVEAKTAAGVNCAGASSHDIGGGHAISAKGAVMVQAGATTMKASGTITLVCGSCKVVVDQSGINIEGATKVEFKGGKIELPETALGT